MDYAPDKEKNVEKGKHDELLSKRGRTRTNTYKSLTLIRQR